MHWILHKMKYRRYGQRPNTKPFVWPIKPVIRKHTRKTHWALIYDNQAWYDLCIYIFT